ncbi:MAG TPA: helix-turn-helix transcriptional regulator [Chitinophagaceae bacterium]|jgi:transcriptional regulator with XRE-family HTH domain|nr:helix-turn-helix transcriptional regulator [Chitinophagaceae bacterium]
MGKGEGHEYLLKFGENLKKLRMSKGLSQRGLASLCTIDHSDISKMERGEINVTILTVLELATALELKPKRLLDIE